MAPSEGAEFEKRREEIRRLYVDEGLSCRQVGLRLVPPITGAAVSRTLERMGLKARPVGPRSPRWLAQKAIERADQLEAQAKGHRKNAERLAKVPRKKKAPRTQGVAGGR